MSSQRLDLICEGCWARRLPGKIGYVELREGMPPRMHVERRPIRRWDNPQPVPKVKALPFDRWGTFLWRCNSGHDLRVKNERYYALVEEAISKGWSRVIIPVS